MTTSPHYDELEVQVASLTYPMTLVLTERHHGHRMPLGVGIELSVGNQTHSTSRAIVNDTNKIWKGCDTCCVRKLFPTQRQVRCEESSYDHHVEVSRAM